MGGVLLSINEFIEEYKNADINFEDCNLRILMKYAERGNKKAQNSLGDRYYNGELGEQNYEKAIKWYKRSASQGYSIAEYNLGYMYYYGLGTKIDYENALKYFKRAAFKGHVDAQCNLGCMFEDGEGTEQN